MLFACTMYMEICTLRLRQPKTPLTLETWSKFKRQLEEEVCACRSISSYCTQLQLNIARIHIETAGVSVFKTFIILVCELLVVYLLTTCHLPDQEINKQFVIHLATGTYLTSSITPGHKTD